MFSARIRRMRRPGRLTARARLASALLALAPAAASGQAVCGDSATAADPRMAGDSLGLPIVIVARVHADAVVFESDPDVRVTLNGCEGGGGLIRHESTLPDTIEPGVRYTDVEVSAEYRVWLTLECRAPEETVARLCEELARRD